MTFTGKSAIVVAISGIRRTWTKLIRCGGNKRMNLNSIALLQQLKAQLEKFKARHPKFPLFLDAVSEHALTEGTVVEIAVSTPDGQNYTSNLRLMAEDIELIRSLKDMNV